MKRISIGVASVLVVIIFMTISARPKVDMRTVYGPFIEARECTIESGMSVEEFIESNPNIVSTRDSWGVHIEECDGLETHGMYEYWSIEVNGRVVTDRSNTKLYDGDLIMFKVKEARGGC